MSSIRGTTSLIKKGNKNKTIICVIKNIKIVINMNKEVYVFRTRTNVYATIGMV